MAYNPYQAYFPQYQTNNSLIWVQGEAGAKSYLVAPGNTVALWDTEAQTVYLKSADASGMPSTKVLDYTIRAEAAQNAAGGVLSPTAGTFTAEDLKGLQDAVKRLRQDVDELKEAKKDAE